MNRMALPVPVRFALRRLKERHWEAYLIGGAPRDILLKKTPKDYDITTNASAEQIEACFSDCRLLFTGKKYGTITLLKDGMPIEITSFRTESGYRDYRHPQVSYTPLLEEDLKRRDFTMNAIAFSPPNQWIDPFGGKEDIQQKIIRCVGKPDERFKEDPLRILRAFRFGSVLTFSIEEETLKAANQLSPLLSHISRERIACEWERLLCGKGVKKTLQEGECILQAIFGHAFSPGFPLDMLKNAEPIYPLRLSLFLLEKTPGEARDILDGLKLKKSLIQQVSFLLSHKKSAPYRKEPLFRRLCGEWGFISIQLLLLFWQAQNEDIGFFEEQLSAIQKKHLCCGLRDLAVNGDDLKNLGIRDGKEIGNQLRSLLLLVTENKLPNIKEELMQYVKSGHSKR